MDQSTLNVQLLEAAAVGDLDLVQQLCDAGANVLCADTEGISCLMKAAENGHALMVEALLELGAPWNQLDNDNYCAGDCRHTTSTTSITCSTSNLSTQILLKHFFE